MSPNRSKILVVEDNKTNRLLMISMLEDLYIVDEYTTPKCQDNFFKNLIPINTCYPMLQFH